jgi:hypothetical protein
VTGIYIRAGLPDPPEPHAAIRRILVAAGISPDKAALLSACLDALRTRPRTEMNKGSYRPGKRGFDAATTFGTDLFDVYRNMGGTAGIRSLRFYDFALECGSIIGVKIPKYENFEMRMHRATRL